MVFMTEDGGADSEADDDARFQLAAESARRIVRRCRAHARITNKSLERYTSSAAASSPFAIDRDSAIAGKHRIAFDQTTRQVETLSNALVSHLSGLHILMQHDTFHGLPAAVIARSIAEVAASCAWILRPEVSADARAARAYAVIFHSLKNSASQLLPEDAEQVTKARELLVRQLGDSGITVTRREKRGTKTDDVAQVSVGSARARTSYNISQRIAEEIPAIGSMYAGLSSSAHGESMNVANVWEVPDVYARLIGHVVHESVAAWSKAVHDWLDLEPGPIGNEADLQNLKQSIHPDTMALIVARSQQTT